MNDRPRPATKEPNEKRAKAQYLCDSPKKIDADIPIKKNVPPVTAPILAARLIGMRLRIFEMLNLPKIKALIKRMYGKVIRPPSIFKYSRPKMLDQSPIAISRKIAQSMPPAIKRSNLIEVIIRFTEKWSSSFCGRSAIGRNLLM